MRQTRARFISPAVAPVPGRLAHLAEMLDRQPEWRLWLLVTVLTAAVFAGDILTGYEVAFSIFYVAPVALAAWHMGWRPALLVVTTCGLAWLIADRLAGNVYSIHAVQYWNMLVRTSFLLIVASTLNRLREVLEHAHELGLTDALTGVANSRCFREMAERELARGRRLGTPVTLAYIDVDRFKSVNDAFGHDAGDALLRAIATTLAASARDIDLAARMGGDEFALLLPGVDADTAPPIIDRILASLDHLVRDAYPAVGFSVGVVTVTDADIRLDDVIGRADRLMYLAKHGAGRHTGFAVLGA